MVCSFSRRPDGRRVRENGAHCFRGNISPTVEAGYRGFEDSLRLYVLNREAGLAITAATSRCQWHGESMDYSQAIESMQVLEQKAASEPASTPRWRKRKWAF